MFGWERLWHKLLKLMSQKTYPEATMMNAFRALQIAIAQLPQELGEALADDDDETFASKVFFMHNWYV